MSGFDPRVGPVWRRSLRMQAAPASCCPCGDAGACLGGHRSGRRHDPGRMAPVTMPPPVGSAYPPWGSQEGAPSGAHSPASLSCLTLAPVDSPDGSTSPPDGGASRASTSCRSRRHCLGGTQVRVDEGCKARHAWRRHARRTWRPSEGVRHGRNTALHRARSPPRPCESVTAGAHDCLRGVAPLRHDAATRAPPVAPRGRRNAPRASHAS